MDLKLSFLLTWPKVYFGSPFSIFVTVEVKLVLGAKGYNETLGGSNGALVQQVALSNE